jgi:hypothetical protein
MKKETIKIHSGLLTSGTHPHNRKDGHYFPAAPAQAKELPCE